MPILQISQKISSNSYNLIIKQARNKYKCISHLNGLLCLQLFALSVFRNVFKQSCPMSMTYMSPNTAHMLIATPQKLGKVPITCISLMDSPPFTKQREYLYWLTPISKIQIILKEFVKHQKN